MILRTHFREGEAGYDALVDRTTEGTLSPQTVSLKLDHLRVQAQKAPGKGVYNVTSSDRRRVSTGSLLSHE
jgi:hypothetical protein